MISLFLAEALMLTLFQNMFGMYVSPIVLFVLALATGLAPLFLQPTLGPAATKRWPQWLQIGLVLFGVIVVSGMMNNIINRHPVLLQQSDIIPQMQVLSQRFLNGEMPYQPIDFGYTLFPTYQPLQWLPFTIPEFLGLDYRWLGLVFWLGAIGVYQYKLSKEALPPWLLGLLCLLPFVVIAGFYQYQWTVLAFTVELLIAAYYLLLAFSVRSKSVWLIGGGILLCLLSRYSVVLWLPLYFLVLLLYWDKKKTLLAASVVLAGFVLLYVLPFMTRDWAFFLKGYEYHSGAAYGEWLHPDGNGKAYHLTQGVGFAIYFFDFASGELIERLKLLQKVHLLVSLATVAAMGFWYYRSLRKYIDPRVFLLCSLKIYLVVFYAFIQIPYTYLMLVPLFVGLPLLLPRFVRNDASHPRQ